MMIWGDENETYGYENCALEIWKEIPDTAMTCLQILPADRPTYQTENNNFFKVVSAHFRVRYGECSTSSPPLPPNIFATSIVYAHYELEEFLVENDVKDGWKSMMKDIVEIRLSLQGSINDKNIYKGSGSQPLTNYYVHLHILNRKTSKLSSLVHHLEEVMVWQMVSHFLLTEWRVLVWRKRKEYLQSARCIKRGLNTTKWKGLFLWAREVGKKKCTSAQRRFGNRHI